MKSQIHPSRSRRKLAWAAALLFATFTTIGFASVNMADQETIVVIAGMIAVLLISLLGFRGVFGLLFAFRADIQSYLLAEHENPLLSRLSHVRQRHPLVFPLALILVCWLPYLVLFFPGVVMYDSTYELFQALGSGAIPAGTPELLHDGAYSDHKPLAHILLMGFLFKTGTALGSQTLGIFLITFTQFVLMAFSCACVIWYLSRLKISGRFATLCLAFLCLLPFIPLYAVSVFNDCMAIGFFILWVICFVEITRTAGRACSRISFCVGMVLFGLAASLFKKPNLYIILVCCVIAAIKYRKQIVPLAFQALVPALVMIVLIPALVFPSLRVVPGEKGEVLGTFLQQTVYYAIAHDGEMNPQDRQRIEQVLDLDKAMEEFSPTTFDPVKYRFDTASTTGELVEYFQTWIKQGLSDPLAYLYAFFAIQHQWFYPDTPFDYYTIYYDAQISDLAERSGAYDIAENLNYESPEPLTIPRDRAENTLDAVKNVPVLKLFGSVALYATWIPVALLFLAHALNKKGWLISSLPVIVSMLVLLISPMMMSRYALPIVCLIPLLAGITFSVASNENESPQSSPETARRIHA